MDGGYVLDFSDRSFAVFFEDFGVDIGDDRYCADGLSKAKRLRRFLRTTEPALAGRVLRALLDYRLASDGGALSEARLQAFEKVVQRLLGASREPVTDDRSEIPDIAFRPAVFSELPIDAALSAALVGRIQEAQSCLRVGAHLAVVILCGSVLEGMCLGFGANDPERVRNAFFRRFQKRAPEKLGSWNLFEWLAVLRHLGDLSPTVEKYGNALRDFRNYVHPGQQLKTGFTPDEHNAKISLQVVLAAAADLTRTHAVRKADGNG